MSEQDDKTAKVQPWKWPLEWATDEKFWRDVASRTTAGLIVAVVIYLVGAAVGVFAFPGVGRVALIILTILIVLLFFFGAVAVWAYYWNKLLAPFKNRFVVHLALEVVGIFISGGILILSIWLIRAGIELSITLTP